MSRVSGETLVVSEPERFRLDAIQPFTSRRLASDSHTQTQTFTEFSRLVRHTAFDERYADRLITTIDQEDQVRFWDVWLVSDISATLRPLLWNIVVTQHEYADISTSFGKEVCGIELWGATEHDATSEQCYQYYVKGGDPNVYRRDRCYTEQGCERPADPNDLPVDLQEVNNLRPLLAGARLL